MRVISRYVPGSAKGGIRAALSLVSYPLLERLRGYPTIGADVIAAMQRTNVIVIHIPKTGGISLNEAIYGLSQKGHLTWDEVRRISPALYRRALKIAVVRDPIDRFLSAHDFLRGGGKGARDRAFRDKWLAGTTVNDFVDRFENEPELFRYTHFRRQTEFVCDVHGNCMVDRLIPYARLQAEFADLFPNLSLPHRNTVKAGRTPRSALSRDSLTVLERFYESDSALHAKSLGVSVS
jgi:hypothetical protein